MNWPALNLGDLDRALRICRETAFVARSMASPVFLGKVFHQYHMIYFFKNQYKEAEQYVLQALEQLEGSGEDSLILLLKLNLAAEEFEAAREAYRQALQAVEGATHRRYLEAVYYNLVLASLALGGWGEAEHYYQAGLPLVELNPEREAPRFDFLRGRLLASGSPPDFEEAEIFFERSIKADEASGAVVFAAQTRFYLAEILVKKGEIDRGLFLLHEIQMLFQNWGIPVWQAKCRQAW